MHFPIRLTSSRDTHLNLDAFDDGDGDDGGQGSVVRCCGCRVPALGDAGAATGRVRPSNAEAMRNSMWQRLACSRRRTLPNGWRTSVALSNCGFGMSRLCMASYTAFESKKLPSMLCFLVYMTDLHEETRTRASPGIDGFSGLRRQFRDWAGFRIETNVR